MPHLPQVSAGVAAGNNRYGGQLGLYASQLGATNVGNETTGINCYSSVLLHGVTTGLEARW